MSKDRNPKRNATRKAKQRRRLPPGAVCCVCGESAPHCLVEHHVMGQAHEGMLTIILCLNCHAKATEGQLEEEVPLSPTGNFLDRVAAILDALGAFLRFLADSVNRLAEQVRSSIGKLDAEVPEWRSALSEGS